MGEDTSAKDPIDNDGKAQRADGKGFGLGHVRKPNWLCLKTLVKK